VYFDIVSNIEYADSYDNKDQLIEDFIKYYNISVLFINLERKPGIFRKIIEYKDLLLTVFNNISSYEDSYSKDFYLNIKEDLDLFYALNRPKQFCGILKDDKIIFDKFLGIPVDNSMSLNDYRKNIEDKYLKYLTVNFNNRMDALVSTSFNTVDLMNYQFDPGLSFSEKYHREKNPLNLEYEFTEEEEILSKFASIMTDDNKNTVNIIRGQFNQKKSDIKEKYFKIRAKQDDFEIWWKNNVSLTKGDNIFSFLNHENVKESFNINLYNVVFFSKHIDILNRVNIDSNILKEILISVNGKNLSNIDDKFFDPFFQYIEKLHISDPVKIARGLKNLYLLDKSNRASKIFVGNSNISLLIPFLIEMDSDFDVSKFLLTTSDVLEESVNEEKPVLLRFQLIKTLFEGDNLYTKASRHKHLRGEELFNKNVVDSEALVSSILNSLPANKENMTQDYEGDLKSIRKVVKMRIKDIGNENLAEFFISTRLINKLGFEIIGNDYDPRMMNDIEDIMLGDDPEKIISLGNDMQRLYLITIFVEDLLSKLLSGGINGYNYTDTVDSKVDSLLKNEDILLILRDVVTSGYKSLSEKMTRFNTDIN